MTLDFVVIIPTYNEATTIKETIQFIKKQKTQATYEIVVVDGGSTDQTVAIAEKYVKVLKSPIKGKAHQLNYAVSQTDSEFIIFLDADTHLPFHYIERVKNAFLKDSELWACGAQLIYTGWKTGIWHTFVVLQALIDFVTFAFCSCIWFLVQRLPYAHYKIKQINYFYNVSMFLYYTMRHVFNYTEFTGSNICIRRTIFEEVGGFIQPPKLGVDMLFSNILRHHIRKKKRGKIRVIHSLFVETDARNIGASRSLRRLVQHRTLEL